MHAKMNGVHHTCMLHLFKNANIFEAWSTSVQIHVCFIRAFS